MIINSQHSNGYFHDNILETSVHYLGGYIDDIFV